MPTAAQFQYQLQSAAQHKKKPGWCGGGWKAKLEKAEPVRSDSGNWMSSRDGRMWTPGPGRYSDGNPHHSSVRYNKMKHSYTAGTLDVQKDRWPGDFSGVRAQYGGVVVNPCRGFSMGTGHGPAQTETLYYESIGRRTKGFTYQGQAPDLNMGHHTASTRKAQPGQPARAAGGGLPGTKFWPPSDPWKHPSCQEFNPQHGTAHMLDPNSNPGPGYYESDYTYSNIGLVDNRVGRISTHEMPRWTSFKGSERKPPAAKDNGVPGPGFYHVKDATQYIRGQGFYPSGIPSVPMRTDPLYDRFESLKDRINRLGKEGLGPASYDPQLDYLSTHNRSDYCYAMLSQPVFEGQGAEDPTPGPQDYQVVGAEMDGQVFRDGVRYSLGGRNALGFGERGDSDDNQLPGPGTYHLPSTLGGPSCGLGIGERPDPSGLGANPDIYIEGPGPLPLDIYKEGTFIIGHPKNTVNPRGIGFLQAQRLSAELVGAGPEGPPLLLPDTRRDITLRTDPVITFPRENGPLAHRPRRRRRPASAPSHRAGLTEEALAQHEAAQPPAPPVTQHPAQGWFPESGDPQPEQVAEITESLGHNQQVAEITESLGPNQTADESRAARWTASDPQSAHSQPLAPQHSVPEQAASHLPASQHPGTRLGGSQPPARRPQSPRHPAMEESTEPLGGGSSEVLAAPTAAPTAVPARNSAAEGLRGSGIEALDPIASEPLRSSQNEGFTAEAGRRRVRVEADWAEDTEVMAAPPGADQPLSTQPLSHSGTQPLDSSFEAELGRPRVTPSASQASRDLPSSAHPLAAEGSMSSTESSEGQGAVRRRTRNRPPGSQV